MAGQAAASEHPGPGQGRLVLSGLCGAVCAGGRPGVSGAAPASTPTLTPTTPSGAPAALLHRPVAGPLLPGAVFLPILPPQVSPA